MNTRVLVATLAVTILLFAATVTYLFRELAEVRESVSALSRGQSDAEFSARVEKGIIAFVEKQQKEAQEKPNQLARNVPKPGDGDHVYGNPDAQISLIEYSDFECPFCKQFHSTVKQLVDSSGGRVNWVYRHLPLNFHEGAAKEAEASECAAELGGNDAFWKFTDAIFERTRSGGKGFPVDNLAPLAGQIGLDQKAFGQCLDSGKMAARVQRDADSGAHAGINGTPGNVLMEIASGKVLVISGAQPLERLNDAIHQLTGTQENATSGH